MRRYFITRPVDGGYAYWDVRDSQAGDLGPNFSVATFYKGMPHAETIAIRLLDSLNFGV